MRPGLSRLAPVGLVAVGAIAATGVWLARGGAVPDARLVGSGSVAAPDRTPAPTSRDVSGHVTLDGAPVAATVVLSSERTEAGAIPERRVDTGPTGAFAFADVGAGEWTITAMGPGLTASAIVVAEDPTGDLAIALGRCRFEVYGAITDASGAPVVGAWVGLAGQRALATSERDGRYRACVSGGVQRLEVRAPDQGAVIRAIAVDGATRVDVALAPEARVLGRVTTADGAAVPGAMVIARGAPDAAGRTDEPGTARAVADRDGRYELRGVGAGSNEVRAVAPGWIAAAAPAIELIAGARRTLALEVARPIAVTGTVTAAGVPVGRTRVRWRSGGGVEASALTGADGRFALAVPPGRARIVVDGRTVLTGGAITDPAAAVALELAPASLVRGRVVAGGKPVGGALIVARGPGYATGTSDATGQFALALESPGRWQIGASSDELGAAARAVPITTERGRDRDLGAIDLAWVGSIAGTVVDERGQPVVGAMVLAQNLDENDFGRSVTGPDGGFRCDKLSGGDGGYELRVVASDTSDAPLAFAGASASPRIELGRGDRHVTGVALAVVAPHATVRGTVVDVAGHPRPDTAVRVLGWASATATTDADGEFTLEVPGAGPFELIATARDGATARAANATTAQPVRITLAAAASLHVTATGFATPPAITLRRLGGTDFATGAAPLDAGGLAPGTYVVQASSGATSDVRTITVADGQQAEVALVARATARVAGRVTIRPTGTSAAGLDCVAAPAIGGIAGFGDAGAVRTDAQGRFTLDVPAGDSELRCWRLDGSVSDVSRLVHVEPGATAAIELSVIAAVDGASLGVSFEIAPEGARLTRVPRSLAMLQVGDLVTRAGGVELAGLSRTGLGFAAFTARATPTTWNVVRGGKSLELTIPAR